MATKKTAAAEEFTEELKKQQRKVTVKIVSSRGHDEYEEVADFALHRIQTEAKEHHKWVYLDGQQRSAETLTIDDLLAADDITLTNALVGG